MKCYLRLCLIALISLALPLSGMAAAQAQAVLCPMQTTGMACMTDMDSGCCQDLGSPDEQGKTCKHGKECKTGSMLQVSIIKPPVTPSSAITLPYSSDFLPAQAPSGVWRPPRA